MPTRIRSDKIPPYLTQLSLTMRSFHAELNPEAYYIPEKKITFPPFSHLDFFPHTHSTWLLSPFTIFIRHLASHSRREKSYTRAGSIKGANYTHTMQLARRNPQKSRRDASQYKFLMPRRTTQSLGPRKRNTYNTARRRVRFLCKKKPNARERTYIYDSPNANWKGEERKDEREQEVSRLRREGVNSTLHIYIYTLSRSSRCNDRGRVYTYSPSRM